MPHRLLSAGASPPVRLSFTGWLSLCLLSRASTSCHLSSHSRRMRQSSTPPLCSHQLVVASHLFALPPPLDAPLPHDWLCAGVFAVITIAIVTLVPRHQAGVVTLNIVAINIRRHQHPLPSLLPSYPVAPLLSLSTLSPVAPSPSLSTSSSVAPLPSSLSSMPVAPSPLWSTLLPVAPSPSLLSSSPVAPSPLLSMSPSVVDVGVRHAVAIVVDVEGMAVLWRRRRCPTT